MQDAGLSKSRRAWVSTLLVIALIAAGYGCLWLWPVTTITIDPLQKPFCGPQQANGFVHPTMYDTQGMRRAHKLIVVVVGFLALWAGRDPGARHLCGSGNVSGTRRICGADIALSGKVSLDDGTFAGRRGKLALVLLFCLLVAREVPSLSKTPNFRDRSAAQMATTNNHATMTLGHADRLAAGDVLFRETTPQYGVLAPVLLAIYERHFGLMALGDQIRLLIGIEIAYWIVAGYLFLVWSRGHWLTCLVPVVLLLEYYWSASLGLLAPNHSPYRTAGLTIALMCMVVLRRASGRRNQWVAGIVAGLAVLANVESGIAATAGLIAYLWRRHAFNGCDRLQGGLLRMAARFLAGFLTSVAGLVLVYRVGCGAWPHAPGLRQYFVYASLSSSGYGSRPFLPELYQSWYFAIWPLVILAHAIWSVLYSAQERTGGFRPSFRIAVGIMLLVWFAYFANRPDPEYISSYLLLYGLLLIDLGRYISRATRRPRAFFGVQAVLGTAVLCLAWMVAWRVIEWSWNPIDCTIKCTRSGIPLVRRDEVTAPKPPKISKAYLSPSYSASLTDRAEYLRKVAGGRRLVYFTVDSHLMPRASGVLSLQEFPDPGEALTRSSYNRLLDSVLKAPVDEVYVDARSAADLIWYGGMFDLLRRDLSRRFRCDAIEHGWEIWRRRTDLAGRSPPVSRR